MKIGSLFLLALAALPLALRAEDVTIYRPQGEATAPAAPVAAPAPAPAAIPVAAPVPAPAAPASAAAPSQSYTVQKGDSLWKIGKGANVTVVALKEANHLTTDEIKVGMVLKIPVAGGPEEVRKAEPAAATTPPPAPPKAVAAPVSAPAPPPAPSHAGNGPGLIYTPEQVALQRKFVDETKELARAGIGYNRDWRPPGERDDWVMDCSNTTRYLYKKVMGIGIERCASDQYYELQQKGLAWEAPLGADGRPDAEALAGRLQIGDLLFWEHTYKPERDPPVTHVMIYLGQNKKGQWLMAGSQMGGGFFNVSGSGPDVYLFDPRRSVGGYSTNFGFKRVTGRFSAYGRPLLLDKGSSVNQLASR